MSNYSKTVDFGAKDALITGDPSKIVSGTEIDDEFDNIATAIATKSNKKLPATTGNLATLDSGGDLGDSGYRLTGAGGTITADAAELETMKGILATTAEINSACDGILVTASDLNITGSPNTADKVVQLDGTGKIPVVLLYQTYDTLPDFIADSENGVTYTLSGVVNSTGIPTKKYEKQVSRSGTISLSFDLSAEYSASAFSVYGQIYINGSSYGTLRNTNSTTPVTYTQEITVASDDLVQIYLWSTHSEVDSQLTSVFFGFDQLL